MGKEKSFTSSYCQYLRTSISCIVNENLKMSKQSKTQKPSTIIGDNNVSISGDITGSTIITGESNKISINESYDKDDLLRRVKEELEAEGEDERAIWKEAEGALYQLTQRIAKRLKRTTESVWEALRVLGGGE